MLALVSLLLAALFGIPPWFLAVCVAVALAVVFLGKDIRIAVAIVCAVMLVLLLG